MPSTSKASNNSSTTASYTRAITPYREKKNPRSTGSCTEAVNLQLRLYQMVLESTVMVCEGLPKPIPFLTLQIPLTLWRSRQRAWGRPGTNWRKGKLGSTSLTREEERCSFRLKLKWSILAVPLSTTVRYNSAKQCRMTRLANKSQVLNKQECATIRN